MATPRKTAAEIKAEAKVAEKVSLVGAAARAYEAVARAEAEAERRVAEARAKAWTTYEAASAAWSREELAEFELQRPPRAWRAAAEAAAEDANSEDDRPALTVVRDEDAAEAAPGDTGGEDGEAAEGDGEADALAEDAEDGKGE